MPTFQTAAEVDIDTQNIVYIWLHDIGVMDIGYRNLSARGDSRLESVRTQKPKNKKKSMFKALAQEIPDLVNLGDKLYVSTGRIMEYVPPICAHPRAQTRIKIATPYQKGGERVEFTLPDPACKIHEQLKKLPNFAHMLNCGFNLNHVIGYAPEARYSNDAYRPNERLVTVWKEPHEPMAFYHTPVEDFDLDRLIDRFKSPVVELWDNLHVPAKTITHYTFDSEQTGGFGDGPDTDTLTVHIKTLGGMPCKLTHSVRFHGGYEYMKTIMDRLKEAGVREERAPSDSN